MSVDFMFAVAEMREVKSDEEIEAMERAFHIGYAMHTTAMKMCRAGVVERQIAGTIEGLALGQGAGISFTSIVSQHGETLHNRRIVLRGFKKEKGQRLSFPRINKFGYESDEEMVKLAQVLNAISFMKSDYTSEMNQQIHQLVSNGINTFRLGSFSIGINDKIVASRMGGAGTSNSGMVETVLSDWLQGGYRIV